MNKDLTYVTGFIQNANTRHDRSTQKYIDLARDFLSTDLQKIVFVEHDISAEVSKISGPNTFVVPIHKDYLPAFTCTKNKHLELPKAVNKEKDTEDYCKVISSKTFLVTKAIEFDPFQTDKFLWVDFGLRHVFKSKEQFLYGLYRNFEFLEEKVKVAGIWNLKEAIKVDPFDAPNWFFAGGVFGGYKKDLLDFDKMCLKQYKENVQNSKITLEVNMWFQVYLENHHRIEWIKTNHGPEILLDF